MPFFRPLPAIQKRIDYAAWLWPDIDLQVVLCNCSHPEYLECLPLRNLIGTFHSNLKFKPNCIIAYKKKCTVSEYFVKLFSTVMKRMTRWAYCFNSPQMLSVLSGDGNFSWKLYLRCSVSYTVYVIIRNSRVCINPKLSKQMTCMISCGQSFTTRKCEDELYEYNFWSAAHQITWNLNINLSIQSSEIRFTERMAIMRFNTNEWAQFVL